MDLLTWLGVGLVLLLIVPLFKAIGGSKGSLFTSSSERATQSWANKLERDLEEIHAKLKETERELHQTEQTIAPEIERANWAENRAARAEERARITEERLELAERRVNLAIQGANTAERKFEQLLLLETDKLRQQLTESETDLSKAGQLLAEKLGKQLLANAVLTDVDAAVAEVSSKLEQFHASLVSLGASDQQTSQSHIEAVVANLKLAHAHQRSSTAKPPKPNKQESKESRVARLGKKVSRLADQHEKNLAVKPH